MTAEPAVSTPPDAAPDTAVPLREAGAVWLGRLRLEEPLPFGGSGNWWRATDLRTGAHHSIEFLDAPASADLAAQWTARFEAATGAMPTGVLRFFRAEGTAATWLCVSGDSPALRAAGAWSAAVQSGADPRAVLRHWLALAEAVAFLHEHALPAHGALSPARLACQPDGAWLLTGYPAAALLPRATEIEFLSPARRGGQTPQATDDTFGLGALAYFALTGGATPLLLAGGAVPVEQSIDRVRQARQLPPTGFPAGWDEAILHAMREVPSLRATSVHALLDAIRATTGLTASKDDFVPEVSRRMRHPPSWRRGARGAAPAAIAGTPTGAAGQILPADWLQKVTEERTQLARERAAAARHQEQLAADLERSAGERREIETLQREVQRERDELTSAQRELQAAQAAAAELRGRLSTLESGLAGREDAVGARLQEFTRREAELTRAQAELHAAQQQLATRTAENEQAVRKLAAERAASTETQTRLERQSIALSADRDKLRAEQEQLARERAAANTLRDESERRRAACEQDERRLRELGGTLEQRGAELEARDKALQEVQRTIAAMAGGADVNKWLAFASQVEARAAAQEKRTAELEGLEQKQRARTAEFEAEQRRIQELQATAQRQAEENAQRRTELDAEKAHVSRLHQEAVQALEVVRRASRAPRAPAAGTPAAAATPAPVSTASEPATPAPAPVRPPALPKEPRVTAVIPEPATPSNSGVPAEAPPPAATPPVPVEIAGASGAATVEATSSATASAALRATLEFGSARRLHVFGGPKVRFGRHGQSDIILIAIVKGQREPTLAVNKEISRRHFELVAEPAGVRVRDGWSEEPGPVRTSGICIDGRRVDAEGANLHSGVVLSVTTRPLSRAIPHWEVTLFGPQGKIARNAPVASLVAVYLKRLDDAPDDMLVLLDRLPLADVLASSAGAPADAALAVTPAGLALVAGGETQPLVAEQSPFAGAKVLSLGFTSPTVSLTG